MSTEPEEKDPNRESDEDIEIKFVPEGTFGGTTEKPIAYKKGEPVPDDTGDQGGGQN